MSFKLSERFKDYVTIWNEAISGIYMAVGFIMIASMIASIQSCNELKHTYSSLAGSIKCGISFDGPETILAFAAIIAMFIAGIANFFYTRRYFRGGHPKTVSGYAGTFSLVFANGYLVYSIASTVIEKKSSSSISIMSMLTSGSSTSWILWAILIAIVVSFIVSVIALIMLFTWSPMTIDSEESGDGEKVEIPAEVATHAMGHDAPASTPAAEATTTAPATSEEKKDLPPMLNADPDAPVADNMEAEHKDAIVEKPILAEGGEAQNTTSSAETPKTVD